jgi:hypothetical protein
MRDALVNLRFVARFLFADDVGPGSTFRQHAKQMSVGIVVVEVDPGPLGAACPDPLDPSGELLIRIVASIPALGTMLPQVYVVRISSSGRRGPLQEQNMIPALRKARQTCPFHQLSCRNSTALRRSGSSWLTIAARRAFVNR